MEMENLLALIEAVSESGLTEFRYEENGMKLRMAKEKISREDLGPQEEVRLREYKPAPDFLKELPDGGGSVIESPLVGTFYAAPSEEAKAFVRVGDVVKKGQTLAIIEAMKLMNEIESEYDGRITEILVKNGQTVEYGQPLFRICKD